MLLEELAPRWQAGRESALRERRGGDCRRAAGAGPKRCLVFVDRLLVTLVHLRLRLGLGLPHAALTELYGVDRSTVSAAIRQVRPLLAARGFAVPDRPGLRLRTLEDVFAYADAEGVDLRTDGTEVQVRRPRAGRPGRKAFVSGKKKQNTIKTTTFSDGQGRHTAGQRGGPARPDARTRQPCAPKASPSSSVSTRTSGRKSTSNAAIPERPIATVAGSACSAAS